METAIDSSRRQSAAVGSASVGSAAVGGSRRLSTTLRAWPAIAAATIGLCFLTQLVAGFFGITLPDQQNIDVVRRCLAQAFASGKAFAVAAFLVAQVIVILPAIEEIVFRGLLVAGVRRLAVRIDGSRRQSTAVESTAIGGSRRQSTAVESTAIDGNRLQSTAVEPTAIDGNRRLSTAIERSRTLFAALAVVSSLLFSAAHYIAQPWPDSAFLALFFFGLAQCWLYRKTGRLWCAILNHGLFNLTNLVLLFLIPQS